MAGITAASINDAIQAAIAETKLYVNTNAVLMNRIQRFGVPRQSYIVPNLNAGTVYDVTENTDVTVSDMTTDGVTITATGKAVRSFVSPLAEISTPEDFGIQVGNRFGVDITGRINQDIFTLGDQFTTSIGTSNVDITLDLIRQARSHLVKANAPGPYFLAITPHVEEDLVAAIYDSTSGLNAFSYGVVHQYETTGQIPNLFGINILTVSDLANGTSAGQKDSADAKCFMFSGAALGINVAIPFKIDSAIDISKAGSQEIVGSIWYGVNILKDSYGVELLVDNKD